MATITQRLELVAKDKTKGAFRSQNRALTSLKRQVLAVAGTYATLHGAISLVSKVVSSTSAYQSYANRLKLVTNGAQELADKQDNLFRIAQKTRTEFGTNVEIYSRLGIALKDAGTSGKDLEGVVEALGLAGAISGANAQEMNAAMIQFSQAAASGVLRGEEFRSVSEQMPVVLQSIAKELGVTIGELRKMAHAGELTTDVFIPALLSALPKLQSEFKKTQVTISQAYIQLQNTMGQLVARDSPLGGVLTEALQDVNTEVETLQLKLTAFSGDDIKDGMLKLRDAILTIAVVLGGKSVVSVLTTANLAKAALWAMSRTPPLIALAAAVWAVTEALEQMRERGEGGKLEIEALQEKALLLAASLRGTEDDLGNGIVALTGKEAVAARKELDEVLARLEKLKDERGRAELFEGGSADDVGLDSGMTGIDPPKDDKKTELTPAQIAALEAKKKFLALQAELERVSELNTQEYIAELKESVRVADLERYAAEGVAAEEAEQNKIRFAEESTKRRKEMIDEVAEHAKKRAEEKKKLEKKAKKETEQNLKSALSIFAGHSKKAFEINKALKIGEAVVNTYAGVTQALSAYPPPYSFVAAAAQLAFGLAQVQQIRSQSFGGSSGGGGGAGGALSASQGGAREGITQGSAVTSTISGGIAGLETEPRDAVNITIEGEGEMSYPRVAKLFKQMEELRHDGMTANIRLVGAA